MNATSKLLTGLFALLMITGQANAGNGNNNAPVAEWTPFASNGTTDIISVKYINGINTGTSPVTYTLAAASSVTGQAYDGNVQDQSAANILLVIENEFKLTTAQTSKISLVSSCDTLASCSKGGDATSLVNANTFTSTKSFDYLAVHYGHGELLFKFSTMQNSFTISGLPNGLSNYRAYSDVTAAVPEPETYAMLMAGLGLMGFVARHRKNKQA